MEGSSSRDIGIRTAAPPCMSSTGAAAPPAYQVLGSNGAGSMLVATNATTSYTPYETIADVSVLDSSGRETWKDRIAYSRFLGWTSTPWFAGPERQGICSTRST